MPERETPVELRTATYPQSTSWTKSPRNRAANQRQTRRVLVLGAPGDLPRALLHPAVMSGQFRIVESIGLDVDDAEAALPRLGQVAQLLREGQADTLLVAGEIGSTTMRRVADLALAFHCQVLAVMATEVLAEHDPVVVWTGESPLIQLARLPHHPISSAVKRTIDIVCAAVGLLVAAPVLAIIAILVMIESPGNPIFKHTRVGFRGRKFNCLKIRTMRVDAESVLRADPEMYDWYRQNHFKIPEERDPRVTRLGRLLRRTSLDEVPQLWNVLIGEMSLVGPRPVVEEELAMYGDDRDLMLSVKPGLTGAWAVNGRQSVGYPDRCALELGYVRERTVVRDVQIMARTAAVLMGMARRVD